VMWSLVFEPVSDVRATDGAVGAWVSSVKLKLAALEWLPATSVWRTCTALEPSAAVKLVAQVVPALIEYSTSDPVSVPVTARVPTLVMWSLALEPVSDVSATPGAVGACVSSVKLKLAALEWLPATSVWRTCTALGPSAAVKLVDQVEPALIEYSTSE